MVQEDNSRVMNVTESLTMSPGLGLLAADDPLSQFTGSGTILNGVGGIVDDIVIVGNDAADVERTALSPEIDFMGYIAYSVCAPIIIIFGIVTNILNLIVLTRPSLRGPTFRYLKWLAVANLLVCMVLLPFTLHSHSSPVPYFAAFYFAHIEVPLGNGLIASGVYIVVGLSIDRFVAVCYPRKYRNLHSYYVASVRIALSFIISFIIYIPMAFYKVVVPASSDTTDGSSVLYLPKENKEVVESQWFIAYEYLLEICVRFAPALMLAVLNTLIIIEFKRISKRRQLLSAGMANNEVSGFPSQSYADCNATTVVNASPPGSADAKNTPRRASIANQNNNNGVPSVSKNLGQLNATFTGDDSTGNGVSTALNQSPTQLQNDTTRSSSTKSNKSNKSNKSSKSSKGSPIREKIQLALINIKAVSTPKATPKAPRGMSERRHDMERRLVMLLASIIVTFFITNIPSAVLSLTYREEKKESLSFQIFRAVANNLEFLNFGLNFVLYFLFSRDIRNAFMSIIRRVVVQVKEGIEGSGSRSKYAATNL